MGWEQRGGRSYYYTAERIGGRVVKRYVGTGTVAELASQLDAINQQRQDAEEESDRAARVELDALMAALVPLDELGDLLTRAALLAAGFRQHHRGDWRRRRKQT